MYCWSNLSVGITARRKPTGAVNCKEAAEIQDLKNAERASRVGRGSQDLDIHAIVL